MGGLRLGAGGREGVGRVGLNENKGFHLIHIQSQTRSVDSKTPNQVSVPEHFARTIATPGTRQWPLATLFAYITSHLDGPSISHTYHTSFGRPLS